jgi:hypothetical protein
MESLGAGNTFLLGAERMGRYANVATPDSSLQRSNRFSISGVICRLRAFAAATKARCGTYKFLKFKLGAWRKAELTNGAFISSRMAINAASWHIAVISAPEHPSVCANDQSWKVAYLSFVATYEGSECFDIECRFDGHVAHTDTKYIHATSEIWWSNV